MNTSIKSNRPLLVLTVIRSIFCLVTVYFLDYLIDFGTAPAIVSLGAILGVLFSLRVALLPVRTFGFALLILAVTASIRVLGVIVTSIGGSAPLQGYALMSHLDLILFAFVISSAFGWCFYRFRNFITYETAVLMLLLLFLLSPHREFHFDKPKVMNSLAWSLGVSQITIFVVAGLGASVLTFLYFFLASLPIPTRIGEERVLVSKRKAGSIKGILFSVAILAIVFWIADRTLSTFSQEAASRTANGVGQDDRKGMSPLGFHSALGTTSQPSALVRLEGDYSNNPFSPMLYLREGSLSEFNGHELVKSTKGFDDDIVGDQVIDGLLGNRMPLIQSIYLLADHKQDFALDFPLAITPLKNPNPGRFKAAYSAFSLAPVFAQAAITDNKVGDPTWPDEMKENYLVTHSDSRYAALAGQITSGITKPIEEAKAISQYLSETAIYTLTPNHDVKPDEDPVAPFLFGDHRGYCVHFAHATVYMLRALGIPSRIATGYLTDLSQAKDGHILLRMADRHAWAEIYVQDIGWVPFDIQPQQVENHADLTVDMKLLEELMGMVDPGEAQLPKDVLKGENNVEELSKIPLPDKRILIIFAIAILVIGGGIKLYLRFGHIFTRSLPRKGVKMYRAVASILRDIGLERNVGETREEFRLRVKQKMEVDPLLIVAPLNQNAYSSTATTSESLRTSFVQSKNDTKKALGWKRIIATLNPSSVMNFISKGRW